jgi:hypothetical protein
MQLLSQDHGRRLEEMRYLKILGGALAVTIAALSILLGIIDIVQFTHNRIAYVTVIGTAKYTLEETGQPQLAPSSTIRIDGKVDVADDSGLFKIPLVKKS